MSSNKVLWFMSGSVLYAEGNINSDGNILSRIRIQDGKTFTQEHNYISTIQT